MARRSPLSLYFSISSLFQLISISLSWVQLDWHSWRFNGNCRQISDWHGVLGSRGFGRMWVLGFWVYWAFDELRCRQQWVGLFTLNMLFVSNFFEAYNSIKAPSFFWFLSFICDLFSSTVLNWPCNNKIFTLFCCS